MIPETLSPNGVHSPKLAVTVEQSLQHLLSDSPKRVEALKVILAMPNMQWNLPGHPSDLRTLEKVHGYIVTVEKDRRDEFLKTLEGVLDRHGGVEEKNPTA